MNEPNPPTSSVTPKRMPTLPPSFSPPFSGEGPGEGLSSEPNPPTPFPEKEGGAIPAPPVRNIVRGQRVDEGKAIRARQLRQEMTPAERALWERLRRNQIDGLHFRRQQVIDGFIADFYCHAVGLVIELDGSIHDSQPEYDAERDSILEGRGLCVLRFRNEEVRVSMDDVLRVIAETCRKRIVKNPSPGPSPEREGRKKGDCLPPDTRGRA